MRRFFLLFLILLLVASLSYFYFWREREEKHDFILLFGNVDVRQVDLGFRVGGMVSAIYFEEGDLVTAGKLVAELDKQPYEDRVREAEANALSIRATLENAEQLLTRRQELISDGSVSLEDLEEAQAKQKSAQANLAAADAALKIAKSNLSFTEVFAPTEGTILTRIREPGSVVNPYEPVCTLSVSAPVWIRAFVDEPELGLVYPGMEAEITTGTRGSIVYRGQVGFISPVAEFTPKTVETTRLRTDLVYRLRIYAENPDRGLRQGMPVTVRLKRRPIE